MGRRPEVKPSATAGGFVVSAPAQEHSGGHPVPVIGLAHGSRHPAGRDAIEDLMAAVGDRRSVPASAAYLDLAEPDLTTVAADLGAAGHARAVVVPLLFTAAFHATVDVPETLAAAAAETGLELGLADIVGTGDDVLDLLVAHAAGTPGFDAALSVLLFAVGSSRPEANEAVAGLAGRLGRRLGRPAAAAFGTCTPRLEAVVPALPEPVALLPLFLADGLLLGPLRTLAADRGWPLAEPLGARAADLVVQRYETALASE